MRRNLVIFSIFLLLGGLTLLSLWAPSPTATSELASSPSTHRCGDACGAHVRPGHRQPIAGPRRALATSPIWRPAPLPAGGAHSALSAGEDGLAAWTGQAGAGLRARAIQPAAVLVSGAPLEPGVRLQLPLFADADFTAVVQQSFVNVNGTVVTMAHLEKSPWGRAAIAFTDGELRIKLLDPDNHRTYAVQYNHDDGHHYALELDPAIVREHGQCQLHEHSRFRDPPAKAAAAPASAAPAARSVATAARGEETATTLVDVMVAYPDNVLAAAGSTANVENLAALGIALANDAHDVSTSGIELQLIHTARLVGHQAADNNTELDFLTDVDGVIDEVHTLRATHGADFVCMMTTDGGGLGWQPNFAVSDTNGRPDLAFSVASWNSFDTYTPAHELGHNMNLDHAKFQVSATGTPSNPTGADAGGWHWHPDGDVNSPGWTSVMSYDVFWNSGSSGPTHGGHTEVGLFSDPTVTNNGQAAGDLTHANCARVLRAYRQIYAGYATRNTLASPDLIVDAPNDAETWQRGTTQKITWETRDVSGNVKIELYKGGVFHQTIAADTLNDRIFFWTIPASVDSGIDYKIRVASIDAPAVADLSDTDFTITEVLLDNNFDVDPGWSRTGDWEFGVPANGNSGGPNIAYTGTNAFDTNLGGVAFADNSLLTIDPIDCTFYENVRITFAAQVSVSAEYTAEFQVSTDGSSWTTLESLTNSTEFGWRLRSFDVAAIAAGQSTVFFRWHHFRNGDSINLAGVAIDDVTISAVLAESIVYEALAFQEAVANDGSIANTINLSLNGQLFTGIDGEDFVATGKALVNNLPAGLTATVVRTSANTATIALTGNAGAHADGDRIANLEIRFTDAAFSGGDAAAVINASRNDLAIEFFSSVSHTVTAPNGGEPLSAGTPTTITWDTVGNSGPVDVMLFRQGAPFATLAANVANTGSLAWTPSFAQSSNNLQIRVRTAAEPNTFDDSDGDFAVLTNIYTANMDSDPGWALDSGWEYGQPSAGDQDEWGNLSPGSAHTGTHVIAYNLSGDYDDNMPERYATVGPINCSGWDDVTLSFQRWLGVESDDFDHAAIRVSNDGSNWTTIFSNSQDPGKDIKDQAWSLFSYDLSAVADDQPTVFVRWVMGPTDFSVQFSGWAIDDVAVSGAARLRPPPAGVDDDYAVDEDNPLSPDAASGVLANDPNRLALTAELVQGPGSGSLTTFAADGAFTYVPQTNFFGVDSFTYRVADGFGVSEPVTVTITVNAVNDDPPVIGLFVAADALSGTTGFSQNGAFNLLVDASDPDGDALDLLISDDSTPPAVGDPKWTPLASADLARDYSQLGEGTYPLFAFVKDPAGNVSAASEASLEYRIPFGFSVQLDDGVAPSETVVAAAWEPVARGAFTNGLDQDAPANARIWLIDLDNDPYRRLTTDFRPDRQRRYWRLHVDPQGGSVDLSWNAAGLVPANYQLLLVPVSGHQIAGAAVDAAAESAISGIAEPREYVIAYAPEETVDLPIAAGWNWIPMPLIGPNAIADVLAPQGASLVLPRQWRFNNRGSLIRREGELFAGRTLFAFAPTAATAGTVTGIRPDGVFPLGPSWRVVPAPDDVPAQSAELAAILQQAVIYRWLPGKRRYERITTTTGIERDATYLLYPRSATTTFINLTNSP